MTELTPIPVEDKDILDFWPIPEFTPRPIQVRALEWMASLPEDVKYIFLQAPVGSGKSLIGATFSNYMHRSWAQNAFLLTPQRILQEQYEQSFDRDFVATLYGKSNYTCRNKNSTCDIGSLVKPACKNCPYENAKAAAKRNPNVVLNYTIAFLAFKYTPIFDLPEREDISAKGRPLMVLDECHTIENHLTELDAVMITEGRCKQIGIPFKMIPMLSAAVKWIKETYIPACEKYSETLYGELRDIIDGHEEPTAEHTTKLRRLKGIDDHIDLIYESILRHKIESLNNQVVLLADKNSMKFKRLTGGAAFRNIVEPMADKFLFMSSTILNYEGFCQDLGIDPSQAAYLDLGSDFPVENRPIMFKPQMKMNYKWKDKENAQHREKMLKYVRKILDDHQDENGIIHSGSFAISRWLVENLEHDIPHKIFHHNPESGDDRNAVIKAFQKSKVPSVLISPSITEGLDLKDDLGRFAIFAKVPFPNMADAWVKRRMEMSNEWYQRQTLINIIQGGGRVVRSKEDWGVTYILDGSFDFLYKRAHQMIPQWWKDSYKVIRT